MYHLPFTGYSALAVNKMNSNVILLFQVLGEMLGTIDGTVLTAGATEGHLQVGEIALDEPLYMMVDKGIDGFQEREYLAVLLEEVDDGLVQAREGLELLVLTGVVGRTAVEHIPAAITGFIDRDAALKREGVDRY